MATPLPGDPGYIPIEIPKMTMGFEDWIAITAAQGMPGWEQLGLWRVINPAVTIELVSRARCRAGFHDDHKEDNARSCWADCLAMGPTSRRSTVSGLVSGDMIESPRCCANGNGLEQL